MGTLKIIEAEYIKDYILRLKFNNGEERFCDFFPLAQKGICKKLLDIVYFRNFTLDPFTVDWNNEIGFAPEFLYDNCFYGISPESSKYKNNQKDLSLCRG